jgi:flagellar basal body-associated protein FliL
MPAMSFCRQCGAAIAPPAVQGDNEQTTALLSKQDLVVTQRLDPRPTSSNASPINLPEQVDKTPKAQKNKLFLVSLVLIVLVVGIAGVVAFRVHNQKRIASAEGVIYPAAHKAMDITSEGGGRAIGLETSDSFAEVDQWYRKTLNPEKVVQLTSIAVVLKTDKITATIVREGDKTHILLKIVP